MTSSTPAAEPTSAATITCPKCEHSISLISCAVLYDSLSCCQAEGCGCTASPAEVAQHAVASAKLTDAELLTVYYSGLASGIGTAMVNFGGIPPEEAEPAARHFVFHVEQDPIARLGAIEELRQLLATGQGNSSWLKISGNGFECEEGQR